MGTEKQLIPMPQVLFVLRDLCAKRETGAFFVATQGGHWAEIVIERGDIIGLRFRNRKGLAAAQALAQATHAKYSFSSVNDVAMYRISLATEPIPPTEDLLQMLLEPEGPSEQEWLEATGVVVRTERVDAERPAADTARIDQTAPPASVSRSPAGAAEGRAPGQFPERSPRQTPPAERPVAGSRPAPGPAAPGARPQQPVAQRPAAMGVRPAAGSGSAQSPHGPQLAPRGPLLHTRPPQPPQHPVPASDAKKVLVVEDSTISRTVITRTLSRKGYRIIEAEDGFQALAQLTNEMPDLVLLDLIMPGMDGYKVLSHMKKKEEFAKIPVIILTSRDTLFDKLRGKMSGSDEYLTKPFSSTELLDKVSQYLD